MLVRFSSDAYESITYFENVANELLSLMGHSGTIPGALITADIPRALDNLQNGLKNHANNTLQKPESSEENEDDEPKISLKLRAVPLINMLQAAQKGDSNIFWDYQ